MPSWSQLATRAKPGPRAQVFAQRAAQIGTLVRLYLLLKFLLGASRHVYAYGISGTAVQFYTAVKNVSDGVGGFRARRGRQRATSLVHHIASLAPAPCTMPTRMPCSRSSTDIQLIVRLMLRLPSARAEVTKELAKTREDLKSKIAPTEYPAGIELENSRSIPEHGHDVEWLRGQWTNMHKLERGDLESGRVSGAVYHVSLPPKCADIRAARSSTLSSTRPSPTSSYPTPSTRMSSPECARWRLTWCPWFSSSSTAKVVAALVSYSAGIRLTPATSGGTESIIMSVKTHRDWARAIKGIKEPEMWEVV